MEGGGGPGEEEVEEEVEFDSFGGCYHKQMNNKNEETKYSSLLVEWILLNLGHCDRGK